MTQVLSSLINSTDRDVFPQQINNLSLQRGKKRRRSSKIGRRSIKRTKDKMRYIDSNNSIVFTVNSYSSFGNPSSETTVSEPPQSTIPSPSPQDNTPPHTISTASPPSSPISSLPIIQSPSSLSSPPPLS